MALINKVLLERCQIIVLNSNGPPALKLKTIQYNAIRRRQQVDNSLIKLAHNYSCEGKAIYFI